MTICTGVSRKEKRGKAPALKKVRLVVGNGEGLNHGGEFEDFDLGRAVGPIVAPANDYVATGVRVAVVAEIAARFSNLDFRVSRWAADCDPIGRILRLAR